MVGNITEATAKIRKVGSLNTRIVEGADKLCQVEVKENGAWTPVVVGLTKVLAENLVSQATKQVICG